MKLNLIISVSIIAFTKLMFGQGIIEDWSYYGNYAQMEHVTKVGDIVYSGNQTGAFFKFDERENSLTKLTKFEGFADARVTELVNVNDKNLLIGYINGHLDYVENNTITNIDDIYRNTTINTSKQINEIIVIDNKSYIATDFGVVVLNNDSKLIVDTYRYIGQGGRELAIKSLTTNANNDSLYLITSEGIQYASLSPEYNLQDFSSWSYFDASSGIPVDSLTSISTWNDNIVCTRQQDLYELNNLTWNIDKSFEEKIIEAKTRNSVFTVTLESEVFVSSNGTPLSKLTSNLIQSPQSVYSADGAYYIADYQKGLIINSTDNNFTQYVLESPSYTQFYNFNYSNKTLSIVQGGINLGGNPTNAPPTIFNQTNYKWNQTDSIASNIISTAYNPVTSKQYYASFGDGLIEESNGSRTLYNYQNSLLDSATGAKTNISDIAIDEFGNTWFTNFTTDQAFDYSLYVIDIEGNWNRYIIPKSTALQALETQQFGTQTWSLCRVTNTKKELLVFDYSSTESNVFNESNAEIAGSITSFDINYEGQITLGTTNGISVIYNNSSSFQNDAATRPIVDGGYLFKEEIINDVKYDGAGKVWIATQQGVYLYNKELSEELLYFNKDNSPLLSNTITKIGINEDNGEVLFNTEEGVFVYYGAATEATESQNDAISIYPNPVHENYFGDITLRGLVRNANVKIVDITGNLVFETDAEGGTATWNINKLNGERVKTGIYLIFTSNDTGDETFIGKIAVVSQ